MRLTLILVGGLILGACQAPNLPAVMEAAGGASVTRDDGEVIYAAIQEVIVQPMIASRDRLAKSGYPQGPLPQLIVVDRTLRCCELTRFNPRECVPMDDMHRLGNGLLSWSVLDRNQFFYRIAEPLGPGVVLANHEDVWPFSGREWLQHFMATHPSGTYDGPILVTAPTYVDAKSYLYVMRFAQAGSWVELQRRERRWIVLRSLGGWQV